MRRHDWAVLSLIGISALGSLGVTSVLFVRWIDAETPRSVILREVPVEPLWHHVPSESETLRETTGEIRWVPFRDNSVRISPHGSYGATLRSRPVEIPFQTNGLKLKIQHRIHLKMRENSVSPGFRFQPTEVRVSKPSGSSAPGG